MASTDQVYWNQNLVGWFQFGGADNFHVFGKWKSAEVPAAASFAESVANEKDVWVKLGSLDSPDWYSVSGIEDGEIEFLFNSVGPGCGIE
ncbi:MAG: hypothetical protein U0744_14530 [Gemmataceae bacterium]